LLSRSSPSYLSVEGNLETGPAGGTDDKSVSEVSEPMGLINPKNDTRIAHEMLQGVHSLLLEVADKIANGSSCFDGEDGAAVSAYISSMSTVAEAIRSAVRDAAQKQNAE
jgi:hypothetical protein